MLWDKEKGPRQAWWRMPRNGRTGCHSYKGQGPLREAVFEQSLTSGNRESHMAAGRAFWMEGTAGAKALSQEGARASEEQQGLVWLPRAGS